jgi:hypothetical protein
MWEDRAGDKSRVKWCIGIDHGDKQTLEAALGGCSLRTHVAIGGDNYVLAANAACRKLDQLDVDYIIVVSDDFIPPHNWDMALDRVIAENDNTRKAVIHVNDGGEGTLCTLPIVGVERYRRFGWMFYPGYESLFSDTELTARAQLDQVLVDARHLLFEHLHPVNGKRPADEVDKKHASQSRWDSGKRMFQSRLAVGFPPMKCHHDRPPVLADRYVASLMVCRDDVCLEGVVAALLRDGVRNFAFNVPKHHWDGSETPEEDKQVIRDIAYGLLRHGAWWVRVYEDSLAPFFFPGQERWRLETHYRNHSLERLRNLGFQHQLIVDGDELFLQGAMAALDYNVRWHNPTTAALRGIPLVGLPAVAVDGATDRITCYIGPGETWRDIRSPHKPTLDVGMFGILHFSAVRRTRDELIAKMRGSGHYDDKDYDFEGWIKDVLPNMKPGMKNVHMYKDGSLWPLTRLLHDHEWQSVPDCVRPLIYREPQVVQTVDETDKKAWALGEVKPS